MISVICVYNNKQILENYLLKSLKTQSVDYELILLDNRKGKYKSAAEALNDGGNRAQGDYLMFVHQDVDLKSSILLQETELIMKNLDNCGIAGVAGVPENGILMSNIENGIPPIKPGVEIKNPVPVQTLDECLVIIPQSVFHESKFDTRLSGWHLYSVDYCLHMIKKGYAAYVLPLYVYHRSYMIFYSQDYYNILKIVLKKYKDSYKKIYTSCGTWNTRYPTIWYRFLNTKIGLKLRSLINKIK